MPRLGQLDANHVMKQAECFSLCYLSRYPDEAIPPRVDASFKRAWGMTTLYRKPAVTGGRPGYAVAIWPDAGLTRVTVAIDGIASASQLRTHFGTQVSVRYAPARGRVLQSFAAYADTIYAELMANAFFLDGFNRLNTQITFTGFSMGAALAEVLSVKCFLAHGAKRYQVVKFGSPRVGNAAWASPENLMWDRLDVYVHNDPIHLFPYSTFKYSGLLAPDLDNIITSYAQNAPVATRTIVGENSTTPQADSTYAYSRAGIAGLAAMTPDNVWYYHFADAYRLMLMNRTAENIQGLSDEWFRFHFLEFDDDNQWGTIFTTGQETYAGLTGLADPPPSDFQVPSNPALEAMQVNLAARGHTPQTPRPTPLQANNNKTLPMGLWRPRRTRDF